MKNLPAVILLALTFGMGSVTGAAAQTILDMKGTWVGHSEGIFDGPSLHNPNVTPHPKTSDKYLLTSVTATIHIEGQDGRRFWGTLSTPNHSERLIGSLSATGKNVFMVDDDGFYDGEVVDADTIDLCYRQITTRNRSLSCALRKRQK